jgi:AsmA protein
LRGAVGALDGNLDGERWQSHQKLRAEVAWHERKTGLSAALAKTALEEDPRRDAQESLVVHSKKARRLMGRIARYVGIAVIVLLLVLLSLPFLIDANQFRPLLVSQLSQALGRQVKVGDLKLSILSGGVSAADLSIADDPSFSQAPFVSAKSMKIGVDLWRYISARKLNVTEITIEGPRIALLQTSAGTWNFSRLGANLSKTPSPQAAPPGARLDLSVNLVKIAGGRLSLGQANSNSKPIALENVNIELRDFSPTSIMPFSLTASVAGGGDVKIKGKAGPINQVDTVLTPVEVSLTVTQLDLAGSQFTGPASGIAGLVSLDGSAGSNGQSLQVKGRIKAEKMKMVRTGSPAGRPVEFDFAAAYDLGTRSGTLSHGDIHIGAARATLTGTFAIRGESTVLNMNLYGPNMPVTELAAMLPALDIVLPKGSSLQGGSAGVRLAVQGPTDRLVANGALGLRNTRLAGYNMGSAMSTVAKLAGVQAGTNTDIQSFSANVRMAPEGMTADSIQLVVPALGSMTGAGTISASHALNFTMRATLQAAGGMLAMIGQSGGTAVPFFIQGTSSDPVFRPDVRGMAEENSKTLQKMGIGAAKKAGGVFGNLLDGLKGK